MSDFMKWMDHHTTKCTVCGQPFLKRDEWGYWYDDSICCSYHCMRVARQRDIERYEHRQQEYVHREMKPITQEEKDRAIMLWLEDKSVDNIAREMGRCQDSIRKIIREAGLWNRGTRRKSTVPKNRTPREKVDQIIKMRNEGATVTQIVIETGLSESTVYSYIRNGGRTRQSSEKRRW